MKIMDEESRHFARAGVRAIPTMKKEPPLSQDSRKASRAKSVLHSSLYSSSERHAAHGE